MGGGDARRLRTVLMVVVVLTVAAAVGAALRAGGSDDATPNVELATTSESVSPSVSAPGMNTAAQQVFPDLSALNDVSDRHDVSQGYPLATFTSPTGLQCAMWSTRGDTAAYCFGPIPGLDREANQVYAGDFESYFEQSTPPAEDKLNGKPLASGEKIVLGAGGSLVGGDQITCGVKELVVACELIVDFQANHGDGTAQRHGFVVSQQGSWTF